MMAECWSHRGESKVGRQVRKQVRYGLRNGFMTPRRMPELMKHCLLVVEFTDCRDTAGGDALVEYTVEVRVHDCVVFV